MSIRRSSQNLDLEELRPPSLTPRSLMGYFGPGIILMMTGIGTSHLVTAPTAGGRFQFALLWCIPVAYIFKYYGFEMAFRFTNATGKSLLEAYGTAWRKWPLWYVLMTTLVQCAIGQAGRLIAASAVLYSVFTVSLGLPLPLGAYAVVLGAASVAVLLSGSYRSVENVAKAAAIALCLSTIAVYLVRPAPLDALQHFWIVETPVGSWLLIAAFLGLLPTGLDVSLQASEWGKAKRAGMSHIRPELERRGLAKPFDPFSSAKEDLAVDPDRLPDTAQEYCRQWFRISLWDFRLGHVVSFAMACIFLLLAAVWLYPSPVEGRAVMGEIAGIFTNSVGPWMMAVFLTGAFAATFSTAFNYFDGWPRVVGACCRNMFHSTARLQGIGRDDLTEEHRREWSSEYNIYRATMFFSLISAVAIVIGLPRPVFLVLVASALAFFVAPAIFFLNLYYCLTVIPKHASHYYPTPLAIFFGAASLVVFSGLSGILIAARVFGIQLFG
ncbi:MAG TPA: Nramp family divalent metal transporter [Acidobacteriota bacterium]|nr:Nramp family divalent metal transporter [Acidobacteriota bacterium]